MNNVPVECKMKQGRIQGWVDEFKPPPKCWEILVTWDYIPQQILMIKSHVPEDVAKRCILTSVIARKCACHLGALTALPQIRPPSWVWGRKGVGKGMEEKEY